MTVQCLYQNDPKDAAAVLGQRNACRRAANKLGWLIQQERICDASEGTPLLLRPDVQELLRDVDPARCQRDRVGTHVKNRDSIQVHLGKESFHFLFIVAKTVHAGDHQQVEAAVAHIVQNRLDAGSVIHASGAELQRLKHFPPNSPSIACGCRQAPFLLFPQDGFFLDFVAGIKTFHYNHGFSSFLSRTAATKKAR